MTHANNETQAALIRHDRLLSVADIAGTFLFAIEGATAAVTGDLDLLGLMVLAFSTALAGGITRDLLIGAVPPQSLRDWRYPTVAFTGAAIVFFLHPLFENLADTASHRSGCRRARAVRGRRHRKSAQIQNASVCRGIAGHHHSRRRRDDSRYFSSADSECTSRRRLRHRRAHRFGGNDRRAAISNGRYAVCHSWRVVVFRDSPDQRLAALESAARSDLIPPLAALRAR